MLHPDAHIFSHHASKDPVPPWGTLDRFLLRTEQTGWAVLYSKKEANPCSVCTYGWAHHEVSGLGGFDCSCSRASLQGNHQYHAHLAARFLWKPKWPWVKTKPSKPAKPPQPSTTVRAGCNARFLLTRSAFPVLYLVLAPERGPRDGKPTPNPEAWESRSALATRHERYPAGYSRGRRISDAIEGLIEEMAPDREFAATARCLECRQRSYVQ